MHALRDELIWMMIGYDPIYPDHGPTLAAGIAIGIVAGSLVTWRFMLRHRLRKFP